MISLKPREQFAIVWQKDNHNDVGTYYVRAVIRNSVSGSVIDTVNLTDNGDGRFSKIWEVPSDVSGEGFYIDMTISVYSDSGYTTKATTYGDVNAQYLVYDRRPPSVGGGGVDVDYKKIEKIITETIKPLTGLKNIDLGPVLTQIRGVLGAVQGIKIPNPEKLDQTPVLNEIKTTKDIIVKAIADKEVTPETDLDEVKQKLGDLLKKEPNLEQVFKYFAKIEKLLNDYIADYSSREGAKEKLAEIKEALGGVFRGEDFKPAPMKPKKDSRVMKLLGLTEKNDDEK